MPSNVTSRSFDATSVPGLSKNAQEALKSAFDAMSNWRVEITKHSEKNCKEVIDKMAAAASELGWPEQVVEAARIQMQRFTETQVKAMDHMMDAWEEQLRSPNPATASPTAMLEKLKSLPTFGSNGMSNGSMNPIQFWMQFAGPWQKFSEEMMAAWAKATKPHAGT
jgi:hypothetical protein